MRTAAKVGSLIGGTWLCLHPSVIPQSWRQAHHHFPSPYIFAQSLFPVIPKAPELEIQGISRKSNFHIEDEDDADCRTGGPVMDGELKSEMGDSGRTQKLL